ncbi:MAG: hypothetical protein AAF683_00425 [Pseudomonadota bacterium]
MSRYSDLKQLMVAVHEYHSTGNVPANAEDLDEVCARVLEEDPFDETAIDWKRISAYVREVHGGDWPEERKIANG